jgi:hypothetical protein
MPDKRLVHDILSESDGKGNQRRPVSFIQHGNLEDGFTYEGVCPWCGLTIGYIPGSQTKVIGGLYRILLHLQKMHWAECEENKVNPPVSFSVEITTSPLGVQKKWSVQ